MPQNRMQALAKSRVVKGKKKPPRSRSQRDAAAQRALRENERERRKRNRSSR